MSVDGNGIQNLLEQADDLLTDSRHPLDQVQTAKVTLMMQQQMVNLLLTIQRDIADLRVSWSQKHAATEERLGKLEDDVKNIKKTMTEYPSITWLLRYKTTPTMRWIVAFLFVLYVVIRNYPAMSTWLGLPPLP